MRAAPPIYGIPNAVRSNLLVREEAEKHRRCRCPFVQIATEWTRGQGPPQYHVVLEIGSVVTWPGKWNSSSVFIRLHQQPFEKRNIYLLVVSCSSRFFDSRLNFTRFYSVGHHVKVSLPIVILSAGDLSESMESRYCSVVIINLYTRIR